MYRAVASEFLRRGARKGVALAAGLRYAAVIHGRDRHAMRVLIGLLLIAAALAGYSWWQSWDAGEARARHERAAAMQRAEASLIRFLDGEERLDVQNLVVSGTAPEGRWDFRGLVIRQ